MKVQAELKIFCDRCKKDALHEIGQSNFIGRGQLPMDGDIESLRGCNINHLCFKCSIEFDKILKLFMETA